MKFSKEIVRCIIKVKQSRKLNEKTEKMIYTALRERRWDKTVITGANKL